MEDPLLNPAWSALSGPHRGFAERVGRAARYPHDVSPFAALEDDPSAWEDAAAVLGPGDTAAFPYVPCLPPDNWRVTHQFAVHQMIDDGIEAKESTEAVRLEVADVPEMADLIRRTEPGPFRPRTIEMGTYLGIRRDGKLVAMAGERLRLAGHTEISAVCTDSAYRGQGLASILVRAVAAGIRERDETPMLHVSAENPSAIRLYEALGFRLNRTMNFVVATAPSA